ncbi:MAG: hypothetical protein ACE5KU_01480 [Nitrososphaerales archaeon]
MKFVAEKRYEIHLVSHTHWDREWYRTFQETRVRLIRLIDKLLRILDSDPDYRYFVLDGQAIILDDYLEVRPEKEELLKKYIGEGRILVGPWYISPDEFLVSGEALIRNLILGHKIATDHSYAESQFDIVTRKIALPSALDWTKQPSSIKSI